MAWGLEDRGPGIPLLAAEFAVESDVEAWSLVIDAVCSAPVGELEPESCSIMFPSLCWEGDGVGSGIGPKVGKRGLKVDVPIEGKSGAETARL